MTYQFADLLNSAMFRQNNLTACNFTRCIKDRVMHPNDCYSYESNGIEYAIESIHDFNWNGYVALPKNHPHCNKSLQQIRGLYNNFNGLSYFKSNIIGFSGCNVNDYCYIRDGKLSSKTYRSFDFIKAETEKLVVQVASYYQSYLQRRHASMYENIIINALSGLRDGQHECRTSVRPIQHLPAFDIEINFEGINTKKQEPIKPTVQTRSSGSNDSCESIISDMISQLIKTLGEPTKSSESIKSNTSCRPTRSTESSEPIRSNMSCKSTESSEPIRSNMSCRPTRSTRSAVPCRPVKFIRIDKPTASTKSAQSTSSNETADTKLEEMICKIALIDSVCPGFLKDLMKSVKDESETKCSESENETDSNSDNDSELFSESCHSNNNSDDDSNNDTQSKEITDADDSGDNCENDFYEKVTRFENAPKPQAQLSDPVTSTKKDYDTEDNSNITVTNNGIIVDIPEEY